MGSTSINKSPSNLEMTPKFRRNTKKLKLLSLELEITKSRKKSQKTTPSKQSKAEGADTTPFKEKKRVESPVGGEKKEEQYDTVMSRTRSGGTPRCCGGDGNEGRSSLALKLDYEQIMEAWSHKNNVCVDREPPQTVPDLHASADVFTGGGREALSLLTVPEMETTERLWRGHREASLLRYKEKRQNRLFSKRIRYQVRKLNAEKRPRIKGRFVKRDDL
ncbi:hypothetical protein Rs2_12044 [Raphanus sativus]|nr:hypothetical protein Rs2_12044 [Raphanus sativus]